MEQFNLVTKNFFFFFFISKYFKTKLVLNLIPQIHHNVLFGLNLIHIGAVQTWVNDLAMSGDRERRKPCGQALDERGTKPKFLKNTHKALHCFTTPLLNITCLERRDITWDKRDQAWHQSDLSLYPSSHTQTQDIFMGGVQTSRGFLNDIKSQALMHSSYVTSLLKRAPSLSEPLTTGL